MQYYITLADGSTVPFDGSGLLVNTETLTGATTLTEEDSGKVFILSGLAGAAITLPAVFNGMKYRFIIGAGFATTDWTVVSTTDVIYGSANVNSVTVLGATENTISFVATAETIGDWVEITSDGVNIYANGVGAAAGGITFTAPV